MRIAIVHYTAPPIIGGVERIVAEQAAVLAKQGHHVTVVCGNETASLRCADVVVRCARELKSASGDATCGLETALESRPEVAAPFVPLEMALVDHDVIIVHNLFTMPFNLPATRMLRQLAVEWNKVHWINWVHDVAAVNPNYAHLPWDDADHAMIRQPAPNCTNVAVSDVRRRQYLDLLRLPESACCVIPNGIDVAHIMGLTDRVAQLAAELRLWERECVLLHPARVLRRKNIELSIRVVKAMTDLGLDAVLLVTGAPDPHNPDGVKYAEELFALVAEHELQDAVLFLGEAAAINDDDVRSLYGATDVVVFPSFSEGFGLPILEAALHTIPVFCSDIPAHREVGQNTAQFFALDDAPADIALRITEHPLVTQRYVRRTTIAACIDWSTIYAQHLAGLIGP